MPANFVKPMLAADISADLDKLRFPVYATPKLDGVRAMIYEDGVYSRSGKKIPNAGVQRDFGIPELVGLDGELIVGSPTAPDVYRTTQSATSRAEDVDESASFYVFDAFVFDGPYSDRLRHVNFGLDICAVERTYRVETVVCTNLHELLRAETKYLDEGYEGVILRNPGTLYKHGRSTIKEQGMLKLKRFTDGEAEIIGIEEEMHNGNEATRDVFGRTDRSSHKGNLTGKERMGALVVRDSVTGVEFKIGTGFTAIDREKFWAGHEDGYQVGCVVKYKHFAIGAKDKPRFPTYLGLREGWDL